MWKKLFNGSQEKSEIKKELSILESLDPAKLPRHVAIIMDGNGRWAQGQGMVRTAGHAAGEKTLREIVRTASRLHIEALTVYAFSTENWKRPQTEVDFLMKLFSEALAKERGEMDKENVRIGFIGRISELSPKLQEEFAKAVERTKNNTGVKFNLAINYGGQDEIVRAMQKMAIKVQAGELSPQDITPEMVDDELDTAGLPPVDLVIRTSGDIRVSNFLLWQAAYAEYYFTETNWPDFTPEEFGEALAEFASRERRFGGLKK